MRTHYDTYRRVYDDVNADAPSWEPDAETPEGGTAPG